MLIEDSLALLEDLDAVQRGGDIAVVVRQITLLADATYAIELVPADGEALPAFTAGAHVDLVLPTGIRRSYSLCNAQDERHRYVVGVKKVEPSRGASAYVHDRLRVGQRIAVSPPRNNFRLDEAAAHSVLIAGGIGITPIWAMVQRLHATGASWELHYACRTRKDAAFLDQISRLAGSDGGRLDVRFDHEPGSELLDLGAIVAKRDRPGTHFYACGPGPMLDAFERATIAVDPLRRHLERFSAEPRERAADAADGFEVVLARTGQTLTVPKNTSILDVLLDEGIDIPFSCMDGVCGSCKVKVLEGTPDHRDMVLSDDEKAGNGVMMVCCSGSRGPRLKLDL